MKHRVCLLSVTIILLWLCSCGKPADRFKWTTDGKTTEVSLEKKSDSLYILHLTTEQPFHSTWELPYPVYRFDYGHITGEGNPEIVVGVIKPTRFDPKPDKRLFIYRIAEGIYIRPLWLGSRVAQPLEDFKVIRTETPARIRTIERERSGKFLVAEYKWRGFGLDFKGYVKREIEKQEATRLLND